MKKNIGLIGIISLISLLVLSACSGSAPEADSAPAEGEVAADSSSEEVEEAVAEETTAEAAEASTEDTASVDTAPIKIGVLTPTSSIAAQSAEDMMNGFNLFWEQHGLEIAGRPIEIYVEDTAGDPDQALSKARLLVEQREVDILFGTVFANVGYAVADYMEEAEIPFLAFTGSDDLTQRRQIPNVIRAVQFASSAPHHAFGEWVAQNTDCKSVYTIGSDYAFGHEVIGGFVNTFTDNGGTVQEQVWNPVPEADFSSYIAAIATAEPDCVFALQVGAAAIRFHQAWNDFGLKDQIPLYMGEIPTDQSILRGIDPPEIVEGQITAGHYAEGWDHPATQAFVETYDDRFGVIPSFYSTNAYVSAQWMATALETVNGDLSDRDAFLEAVRTIELADSPLGPIKMDEYGNPIQTMFVRQVELREDGRPWNAVIAEIPNVSQFYNYNPEEFLAQPVYTRDYQGVDWP